jgi:hypothetical protein
MCQQREIAARRPSDFLAVGFLRTEPLSAERAQANPATAIAAAGSTWAKGT